MTRDTEVSFSREIRNRIRLCVAAYAYEIANDPVMSDADFDALAASIQRYERTGSAVLDLLFIEAFDPSTSIWIHEHPDLAGIARLYETHYKDHLI